MTGIVLCGGQSRRMGRDKGLLKSSSGICWSELACQLLSTVCSSVVLSVNERQEIDYQLYFPSSQLVPDYLPLTIKGPLRGILSVHRKFPNEDLLVLACDMTDMCAEVLEKLIFEFNQGDWEAATFLRGRYYEPLCAIYGASGLCKLTAMHEREELRENRMQYILDELMIRRIQVPERWMAYFNNYNTPGEGQLSLDYLNRFD